MGDLVCPRCGAEAIRVQQDGGLACTMDCHETLRDVAIRKELEGLTADLARLVGAHTPKGYIFTLILASADDGGAKTSNALAYASSGQRQDCVSMLREMADRLDSERGKPS